MSDDLWTVGGTPTTIEAPADQPEPRTELRGERGPELERFDEPAVVTPQPEVTSVAPPPGLPFPFLGEVFHMRPIEDYQWQLLVWADMSERGERVGPIAQNAATLRLLRACLVDGEWPRFAALADRERAQTIRDLMPVVIMLHTRSTGLPTVPPSDSSDGRPSTPVSSGGGLSSLVIAREEANGRPDRAQMVGMAAQAREGGRSET